MSTLVITIPILPGKLEAWRRLCQEITGRRQPDYEESRRQLGVASEAVWLLRTRRADVAVLHVDAEEPKRLLARLVASEHPFDRWFRQQLIHVCGLDLTPAFLGPAMELLFEWQQVGVAPASA